MGLKASVFQKRTRRGDTDLFIIGNERGIKAAITNYGARVVALWAADREGNIDNVVAGYDSIQQYRENDEYYLGAAVGRYANRIGTASFSLNGERFEVTANEGAHHIHGGHHGLHDAVWEVINYNSAGELKLQHILKDGDEGFPGNLKVEISYRISGKNGLLMEYSALSDRDTVVNLTNHSYFNLSGEGRNADVYDHLLRINADEITALDREKIPTGQLLDVQGTPFDFRESSRVGKGLKKSHTQLEIGGGYDHNFVLKKDNNTRFMPAALLRDPFTGRQMEVRTTEPGLQLFACRFPPEMDLNFSSAICLEPQHFPDSPNKPHFPSTVLRAGETFQSKTEYRFGTF